MKKTSLSIAGSDSCGGAGIQADIKTKTMNGVYAMIAVTALTAQNTTGVKSIMEASTQFLTDQIDVVFDGIRPDSIKIGMVSSGDLIQVIAQRLTYYNAKNIVVDPVMVATSGSQLIKTDAVSAMASQLLPLAVHVTPNLSEAEVLFDIKINSKEDIEIAAKIIGDTYGCAVLVKGRHNVHDAIDFLYTKDHYKWFYGKRIENSNTHGTGCTLSSAIAANLVKGYDLDTSVQKAKKFISGALSAWLDLGKGSDLMDHAFDLSEKIAQENKDR